MSDEGTIRREGETYVVEVRGASYLQGLPGVTCINPNDPEENRLYRKIFHNKKIYLPDEHDFAVATHLKNGMDTIILGTTGYSELTVEQLRKYGVKKGAYEAACKALTIAIAQHLQNTFKGVDVRIVHGSSNTGVDLAAIGAAKELNLRQLGFSCPRFLMYVEDGDGVPVYVAANQKEYAEAFVL